MPSRFSRTTRALTRETPRFALFSWAIAVVFLAAWLAWFIGGTVTVYEISPRARLEVQQAAHPVSALVAGKIVSTAFELGREVRKGDVLVEIDATSEVLRMREEQARLDAIPPRLASLRKEIAFRHQAGSEDSRSAFAATQTAQHRISEASAAAEFARDNARRMKEESRVGSVPQVDALRAATESQKLIAARDALSSDVRRLESDARTRTHQNEALAESLNRTAVSLEGDMATLRATIERLQVEIDRHLVRAPVDGRIGDVVPLHGGAYVAEGQKLGTVIPRGALIIVADFEPAAVLGRIHPGQASRLRLDGFPWAQYGSIEARVSRVGTEVRDSLVRVEFTPTTASLPHVDLQHGLPGAIEVSIERTSPAVLLLRSAGQRLSNASRSSSPASGTRP